MALIMVADDVPAIVELITDILKSRGHQVVSVSDGVQMVEKAKDWKPHLIVSDIMMPGAYGSSAYKSLQQDPDAARIPVVFLTGVPLEQARKIIPDSPGVRILGKPIDMAALLEAVDSLLPKST